MTDMEPPSTLDMRNWLDFAAALNRARARAYWELGDGDGDADEGLLICRELRTPPFLVMILTCARRDTPDVCSPRA
jgi:hypothetical protein